MPNQPAGRRRDRPTRLQVVITLVFALLILPALGAVIAFSYYENAANLKSLSKRFVDRTRDDVIEMSENLLDPVGATLQMLAGSAEQATPAYFRKDESGSLLQLVLLTVPQVDSVYVTFEDGFHRVVSRVDDDRRRSDPRIPADAKWHMSWIDDFKAGARRMRHRTFYDKWPEAIASYTALKALDVHHGPPQYQLVLLQDGLAVSDPFVNPDTGFPVIALGYPIHQDGRIVGVASAQLTFVGLSKLLTSYTASPNSLTVISDQYGKVLAKSFPGPAVETTADGHTEPVRLQDIEVPQVAAAVRQHDATGEATFAFDAGPDGSSYVALFARFSAGHDKPWTVLIVTPLDDFVGELAGTNRKLVWLMLAVVLLESTLIYVMASRLSRPIEVVSDSIETIRSLSFGGALPSGSHIREIAQLQRATRLLDSALRSFSLFAPVDVVRRLIDSGQPLTPGVEQRFVTILFTDVQGFTAIAERVPPAVLSEQTVKYFETVTSAVAEEQGTVDKFIGDAVMAFWGAPAEIDDHVFRACVGALRAHRRMRQLNRRWQAEGRPTMPVRFGLHCDTVLVGTIGSAERLTYTAMGDGVNVAAHVEKLNRTFDTAICISDSVHRALGDRIVTRLLGRMPVKSRGGEVVVHELLGIAGSSDPELAAATVRPLADAPAPAGQ